MHIGIAYSVQTHMVIIKWRPGNPPALEVEPPAAGAILLNIPTTCLYRLNMAYCKNKLQGYNSSALVCAANCL